MPTNWYMILVSGLIPLFIGFLYYNKNLAGGMWMKVNGFNEKDLSTGANMPLILILTFIFSSMMSFFYTSIVIHQGAIFSLFVPEIMEAGSAEYNLFNDLMAKYGDRHRNFGHGVVHGVMTTLFFAFPIIAINAMFERRGWKYILIHTIYWLICLVLMGGLLCATLKYAPL